MREPDVKSVQYCLTEFGQLGVLLGLFCGGVYKLEALGGSSSTIWIIVWSGWQVLERSDASHGRSDGFGPARRAQGNPRGPKVQIGAILGPLRGLCRRSSAFLVPSDSILLERTIEHP